jgi:hypothetical protein
MSIRLTHVFQHRLVIYATVIIKAIRLPIPCAAIGFSLMAPAVPIDVSLFYSPVSILDSRLRPNFSSAIFGDCVN